MKRIIVILICIILSFTGVLYAETETKETDVERQKREQQEATNSYLGSDTDSRARWKLEGDNEWRSMKELDERIKMRIMKQKEVFDFLLNTHQERINI